MVYKPTDPPIRLAKPNDPGARPFRDYLLDAAGERRLGERLLIFVEQWDYLSDELEHPPSAAEYAERWSIPPQSAYRLFGEFRRVFPSEGTPERILRILWDGAGSGMRAIMWIPIIPEFVPAR